MKPYVLLKRAAAMSAAFFIASILMGAPGGSFVWEDFELGTCYWGTQFDGSLMTDGMISPDFPSHGKYGFRGHFAISKEGGRTAFSTAQAGDLTGTKDLYVDLYNASPVTFTAQVIVKQGVQWTWYKTDTLTIKPGWNKDLDFNMAGLKDDSGKLMSAPLNELHLVALVFETKDAGEGLLYMDNIRLSGANPQKVVMVRAEEMASGTAVTITGFEDGTCPLTPDSGYSSATAAEAVSAEEAPEGTHVALLSYDNKQPDDHAGYNLQADMDLSKVTGIVYDAFNPLKEPVDTCIYVNTGANWTYFESSTQSLKPGWNHNITFALKAKTFKSEDSKWTNTASIKGISVTRKIGLTFYPHQITRSNFMVDNLRFLTNDPHSIQNMVNDLFPVTPAIMGTDHLFEGFEKEKTTWGAIIGGSSKATGATIVADDRSTEGTHMLEAHFEFDAKDQQAWFGVDQSMNLKDSSAVKVDIFNPGSESLQAEIVMKLGDTYDWNESKSITIKPGWNKDVTFPLKAKVFKNAATNWQNHAYAEPLDQVKCLYIGFISSGPMKGSAYFDNIRITGASAVTVGAPIPKHELKGRVVMWDPVQVFAADGWQAATSPGSNSFAVISEYSKFEGEDAVVMKYRTISDSQSGQFVKTQQTDWSNVLGLQFDFYNPQPYSLTFTLAVQTGPNWEWQETTEMTLKPGWNRKVQVDITQPIFKSLDTNWSATDLLRTRDDIRAVILNVYPHHAGSGSLIMANLRTIERDLIGPVSTNDVGQVVGVASETQLTFRTLKYTYFESFEGDISQWQPVANTLLIKSNAYPTDGSKSLRIDYQGAFVPNGTTPEFFYKPQKGIIDVSSFSHVQFDVYNPGPPIQMDMAFKTGPVTEWIESNSITVSSGWNRNLDIPLLGNNFKSARTAWKMWDTLRNSNQVREIHFKINNTYGLGTIYLDNIRFVGAGTQQTDGMTSEQVSLKFNPSDSVQLIAAGSVVGTGASQAQFNLDKIRLDLRGGGDQLSLFTGDQVIGTDDPMTMVYGPQIGKQIFGADERYYLKDIAMVQASGFAQYGATPNTLGNTTGYMARVKSAALYDCYFGAGLVGARFGNVPGSNPLTSNVESDVKTYEADMQGYLKDLRVGFHGEVAQSAYDGYSGSPYHLQGDGNNNAYYAELDYQLGAFKIQGTRLEHQLNFFNPFSSAAYQGSDQNSVQFYWQMDTFSLVKEMQTWGRFWNDFLTGLNFQIQYYDYSSESNTYANHDLRAFLQNNTYRPPLYMNFWWHWYQEGHQVGDSALPNPSIGDNTLITTSNYELHYQFNPKLVLTGLFRDSFTDYWEAFTYATNIKWKFWGNTWVTGDYKYVGQYGSRFGQFNNFSAGFTKYFMDNSIQASLTYGAPSFVGYWEDDNNLQTVDEWALSLTGKF